MNLVASAAAWAAVTAVAVLVAPAAAHGAGHTCDAIEARAIEVGGAHDDWRGFAGFRAGPADDAAVTVRCAFDAARLFVVVDVVDDRLVRTRQGDPGGEDHVSFALAARTGGPRLAFR